MITQSRRTSITSQVLILLAAAAAISMTLLMSAEPAYAEGDLSRQILLVVAVENL